MKAAATPPPEWSQFIPEEGGRWRRRWLNLFLRLTVKHRLDPNADLAALRTFNEGLDARFGYAEPGMRSESLACAGVPCEWVDVPGGRTDRIILYLHGGAFVFRFPRSHAGLSARLCRRVAARALLVDYRLAPEHLYPAAVDDCMAVYRHLLAQNVPARQIVLAGDSAGGNLVLAALHRLKLAGEPLPACAIVMSPVVDFTLSSESLVSNEARDPIFTMRAMLGFRRLYAPPETYLDPAVSPLFGDFTGMPPLLFQVGSSEMLLDESVRAAAKARASGGIAALEIYDRMPHVFQVMQQLPQSEIALDAMARFVREHAGWSA